MAFRRNTLLRLLVLGACSLLLVGIAAAAMPLVKEWWHPKAGDASAGVPDNSVRLVADRPNTFTISPGVVKTLKVETTLVEKATHPRLLRLTGSLSFDPSYMVRVRSRFAGEVIDPGYANGPRTPSASFPTGAASLRPGDRVEKGQLLAVVWSKELGEKKSELVDTLSQMLVDQKILKALEASRSSVPPRSIIEQEAKVAMDRNAVLRVKRTLSTWRLGEDEIDEVEKEATRLFEKRVAGQTVKERDWARVEIKAPFAGTVMEKNISLGDFVDTSTVLYIVADLTHLSVWAHAYEEDLPALQALKPQKRQWTVRLPADPDAKPLPGAIASIGNVIDPTQHTAMVTGLVANPDGKMRVGESATALVDLPPPDDEVEVPTSALIEDGSSSMVILRVNEGRREFALRRVAVARRTSEWIGIRTEPKPDEKARGVQALKPGEHVVTGGALELASALKDVQGTLKE